MRSTSYTNPVHPEYLADPFVFRHEATYWALGTGLRDATGRAETSAYASIFPLIRSQDLVHWESVGHALVRPDPSLGDTFWAPEVASFASTFYLYYSVGFEDRSHQLRVATSDAPGGPFRDTGVALTDLGTCSFAIDPHPFRDRDGRWYLFYARDFLDTNEARSVRAGTALVVSELEGMERLSERTHTVLRARFDWQRFLSNRLMYGRRFDWHTLEGPCVVERGGRYYCFYSGGRWQSADYGVDFAVSNHVTGPYADAGGEHGPRILRSVPGRVHGPGHNSVVLGPDERTHYVAYHAWDAHFSSRRLCIDPLAWSADGPRCTGPTYTPQPIELGD